MEIETDSKKENLDKEIGKIGREMEVIHEINHTPRAIDQFINQDSKEKGGTEEEQGKEILVDEQPVSRPATRNIDVEIPKARNTRSRRGISRGLSRKKSANNKHLVRIFL